MTTFARFWRGLVIAFTALQTALEIGYLRVMYVDRPWRREAIDQLRRRVS